MNKKHFSELALVLTIGLSFLVMAAAGEIRGFLGQPITEFVPLLLLGFG